ncbi:MAG: hypothetical protein NC307_14140 [Roseburia sp.]|nr:hypothetical protein [Roseburia sp.]
MLLEQIERNLTPSKKAADLYYSNHCRKKSKIVDGCIILKGMSSSTPSLLNSIYDTNQYSGGGFYLRHNGIGIAIDPGYHFLDNLHHAVYKYEKDEEKRKIKWYLDEVSYKIAKTYQENGTGFHEDTNTLYLVLPKESGVREDTGILKDIAIDKDGSFRFKWNGENDIRYDVASILENQLRQECGDNLFWLLPAEVGMTFRMTDGAVRCSQCGKFTKDEEHLCPSDEFLTSLFQECSAGLGFQLSSDNYISDYKSGEIRKEYGKRSYPFLMCSSCCINQKCDNRNPI